MKTPETPAGATPAPVAHAAALALAAALSWSCTGDVPYAPDPEHDHASHAPGAQPPPARATLRGLAELAPGVALAPGGEARADASPGDYAALFVLGRRDPDDELAELIRRVDVDDMPVRFTATARDLAGLGTLAGDWYLELRLDHDGDIRATRGDVVGHVGPVRAGEDLVVLLDTALSEDDETLPFELDHAAHTGGLPADDHAHAPDPAPAADAVAHTAAVDAPPRIPGPRMTGTLDIAPEFAELASRGTLFLMLKQGPTRRGMPWASIRIDEPRFPMEVDIGPEHVTLEVENKADMLAGELYFMARLDFDRDAMTRSADDIENDPVKVAGDGESFHTILDRRSEG